MLLHDGRLLNNGNSKALLPLIDTSKLLEPFTQRGLHYHEVREPPEHGLKEYANKARQPSGTENNESGCEIESSPGRSLFHTSRTNEKNKMQLP